MYQLQEINKSDEGITEILLSDQDIDWEAVYNNIRHQIATNPEMLPPDSSTLNKHQITSRTYEW